MKIMHKQTVIEEIDITPEKLAEIFWEMEHKDQASFFHEIGNLADMSDFDKQMFMVGADGSDKAKRVMEIIGTNR